MTDACRVECVTPDAAAAHVAAWMDLETRCLEPSLFNMAAFALPAARFVPGLRPHVLLVWDGARLIGLCLIGPGLPGWPTSAWLHVQAVAAFPLLDRTEARRALSAMLDWNARRLHPGLLLHGMPAEGATARLLASSESTCITIEERRRAVLPSGQAATGLAGKAAKEFRRQARRLAEQGTLAVSSSRTPEAVMADLDGFLALEAAGWKGRRGTALARSAGLAAFVRTMVGGMAGQGACRIDRLDLDNRPIAMGIVLRSGSTAYFWKTAFDETQARFSPGVHLTDAISRVQSAEPGLVLTDSCAAPEHPMIDRLWPDRTGVRDVLVGLERQRTLLGGIARAEQARRRLRQHVKDLVLRVAQRSKS